jgi:4-amino-4-deoxy-L-arabinose transferase-like glycosyltransferase
MRTRAEALPEQPYPPEADAASSQRARAGFLRRLGAAGASRFTRLDIADRIAVLLLVLAALYRFFLILRGWPALDSDEAIIGLMARQILYNGQFPYWFWGQQYMGAFQAYFAAPFFAVFGSSALVLHATVLLLTIAWLAVMYRLGRAAFGPAAGLLTLGWLSFGPALGVLRELTAIGGYQEMLLFAALILWGVYARLRQPTPRPHTRQEWRRCLLTYAGIGLMGGLGLWSDLLILPVLLVAAITLVASRTREVLHVGGIVLVVAFFVGGFPYISYNITNKNATYKQIVRQSRPEGRANSLPSPQDWRVQIGETLAVALPTTLGSPHVCINQGSVWGAYPPAEAEHTSVAPGLCDDANIAFSLASITVYLLVVWQLLQLLRLWVRALPWLSGTRRTSASQGGRKGRQGQRERSARYWLQFMLLGVGALTLALYTTSIDAQRYQFTSARYLLPLYLTTPILFGVLWRYSASLLRSLTQFALANKSRLPRTLTRASQLTRPGRSSYTPRRSVPRTGLPSRQGAARGVISNGIPALALILLCALSLYGGALALVRSFDTTQFAQPVVPTDQVLLTFLDAHHIAAFYSDYWVCYRLTFETDERLLCAVRGQNGDVGLELVNNRNDDYVRRMALVPHPAYILPAGSPEDSHFPAEALAAGLPHVGYLRAVVAGYAVYYSP